MKYLGSMPDSFFRILSAEEEEVFRQWVRDNWKPDYKPEGFPVMHPVVRDEWRKLDEEDSSEPPLLASCDICEKLAELTRIVECGIDTDACQDCINNPTY